MRLVRLQNTPLDRTRRYLGMSVKAGVLKIQNLGGRRELRDDSEGLLFLESARFGELSCGPEGLAGLPFRDLGRLQVDSSVHPGVPESFPLDVLPAGQAGQICRDGAQLDWLAVLVFELAGHVG